MYVTTFLFLQYACMMLTEYVLPNGKRYKVALSQVDYDDPSFVWC